MSSTCDCIGQRLFFVIQLSVAQMAFHSIRTPRPARALSGPVLASAWWCLACYNQCTYIREPRPNAWSIAWYEHNKSLLGIWKQRLGTKNEDGNGLP